MRLIVIKNGVLHENTTDYNSVKEYIRVNHLPYTFIRMRRTHGQGYVATNGIDKYRIHVVY